MDVGVAEIRASDAAGVLAAIAGDEHPDATNSSSRTLNGRGPMQEERTARGDCYTWGATDQPITTTVT